MSDPNQDSEPECNTGPECDSDAQLRTQSYLRSMFELNPVWQSTQILALRRNTLGLTTTVAAATPKDFAKLAETQRHREQAKKRLSDLQIQFYHLPQADLEKQILDLQQFDLPELKPAIHRLCVIAEYRQVMSELFHHPGIDSNLIKAFGGMLVRPPSDAGYLREEFLQSLVSIPHLHHAKQTAQVIAEHYPTLFELERDWLLTILKTTEPTRRIPIKRM